MMSFPQGLIEQTTRTIAAFLKRKSSIVLEFDSKKFSQQLSRFIGNDELIVEIGVGKGLFMKSYAEKSPQKKFVGIEKVKKWLRHATSRMEKKELHNVRLLCVAAEEVLEVLPQNRISEFYVLFPDPWPKRRHAFRRFIQTDTLKKIHGMLRSNGRLYIATDHADYYQWILKTIHPLMGKQFRSTEGRPEFVSNYQMKYEKEGRPIFTLHVEKITN